MKVGKLAAKYSGNTALRYEAERISGQKWRLEEEAVLTLLKGLPASIRLLDIPVGTGRFIPIYQELGISATGMDVSSDMLEQARDKVIARGANVMIRESSIFAIDAGRDSFDCVLSVRFLNWINSQKLSDALTELARVSCKHLIVGIRHFVPVRELQPLSLRLARQLVRRVFRKNGLFCHEKSVVYSLFEREQLRIRIAVPIDERADGTDYYIYHLLKESSLS